MRIDNQWGRNEKRSLQLVPPIAVRTIHCAQSIHVECLSHLNYQQFFQIYYPEINFPLSIELKGFAAPEGIS